MNKLLFTFNQDFGEKIVLIANNAKDLEDHLKSEYDWHTIEFLENEVLIKTRPSFATEVGTLTWVKHI